MGFSNNFSRRIETAANMATIVVALTLSVVLMKWYLLPTASAGVRQSLKQRPQTLAGANLTTRLKGIDWRANNHTLLLVISTHCHFCTESAPFFRRLDREAQGHAKIVAVLPEAARGSGLLSKT
jgi:hypothetical protein